MRRILALAALFLAAITAFPAFAGTWELSYEKDGVKVSKMEVEGTKLIAFKGETVYDEPMGRVMHVLMDNDHRIEWVDRLYTNHVISRKSEFDYVIYQAFDLPALFAKRDYVYHGLATQDPATGVVTLKMQSVEHPEAPETVGVRAELINSRYVLTPLDDGKKTKVEVEIMTDPKGWMPVWLVNMVQKDWPLETLNGIRAQFAKPHMGTHKLPGDAAKAKAAAAAEAEETDQAGNGEAIEGAGEAEDTDAEAPAEDAPTEPAKAPAEPAKAPAAE